MSAAAECVVTLPATERHYSPQEIAKLWNVSIGTVRRLFENEHGVLAIRVGKKSGGRRAYTTLRIPEAVIERVHRRMLNV
jgi:hypothetical protein